jgi:flap endonuclease-1
MGIPKLNRWLIDNCSPNSIKKIHLSEFQDKKIAVDISIYLYRFLMDGRFHENMYLFLSILKYYRIQPIFVFDGKAPAEKRAILQKRKKDKQEAYSEFTLLENQLSTLMNDQTKKREIQEKMAALKKRMIKITWQHIDDAIELLTAFGFEYYLAPHEADELCVHLAVTKKVYAILSDDMDLLISGATIVLRSMNMMTHDIILYDTTSILKDIDMTLNEFRETVVLSGTDYDIQRQGIHIKKCFELFKEYKCCSIISQSFTEWLGQKGIIDPGEFKHICSLFDTSANVNELDDFIKEKKVVTKMNLDAIKKIMRLHKFIFIGDHSIV